MLRNNTPDANIRTFTKEKLLGLAYTNSINPKKDTAHEYIAYIIDSITLLTIPIIPSTLSLLLYNILISPRFRYIRSRILVETVTHFFK